MFVVVVVVNWLSLVGLGGGGKHLDYLIVNDNHDSLWALATSITKSRNCESFVQSNV